MICGKQIYTSQEEVHRVISGHNSNRKRKNAQQKLVGSYFCNDCKGWHVHTKRKAKKKGFKQNQTDKQDIAYVPEIKWNNQNRQSRRENLTIHTHLKIK